MKAISLISGGIDSPVASYLVLRKKVDVVFLHIKSELYYDKKNTWKTIKLVKKLSEIFNTKLKLYIANHDLFYKKVMIGVKNGFITSKNVCVLCKRNMLRIAEEVKNIENADFIVTGENLAQVASQTPTNMIVIDSAVKSFVVRPLLTLNKQEIIKISKDIKTYEISVEKSSGCNALPKNPTTKANLKKVTEEEDYLNIREITKKIISELECMMINAKD